MNNMRIKKIIYRIKFFFSRFKKYDTRNDDYIYEQDDE